MRRAVAVVLQVGCPGLGISAAHGSGGVPRQVTVLFDPREKYVGQTVLFLGGLRLEDSAGDVGDADCVEASQ